MAKNKIVLIKEFSKKDAIAADEISINFDGFKYSINYKAILKDGSKITYLKDTQPDCKGERALFHIKSFLKDGYYIIAYRLIDDILGI